MAIRRDPIEFGELLLLEHLGGGTQGDVWLARRRDGPAEPLVVKRIPVGRAGDEKLERRLRQEFEVAASIRHPNVVEVLSHGEIDGRLYLAMRYVAGQPLSAVMRSLVQLGRDASVAAVVDIVGDALAGLGALHDARAPSGASLGIVHRDIAPKNLMLDREGRTIVIDLGLSKSEAREWKTATGMVMGTPGYMAPEQAAARPTDARTDLFAVGVVLFELLTLEPYLPGGSLIEIVAASGFDHYRPPSQIRTDVPRALDRIVQRAVAVNPDDRFQTAAEFGAALRAVVPSTSRGSMTLIEKLEWGDVDDEVTRVTELVRDASPTVGVAEVADTVESPGPPARPRIPMTSIAAGVVVVASGFALLYALKDRRLDRPSPPPTSITPAPPTPQIEARPKPRPPPPPAPPPKRTVSAPPPKSPPRKVQKASPPTAPTPPPARPKGTEVDRLIARARATRDRASTPALRKEAGAILVLLNKLRLAESRGQHVDPDKAKQRLDELEQRL